jgi:serine/threonine protein kinase
VSRHDDVRIHRLIQALLDHPASERQRWLAENLPDEPDLQAQLMDAVGDGSEPDSVNEVAFVVAPVRPQLPVMPAQFGRYEIRGQIGSGAMGVLYLAVDPALNRQVAVKVLLCDDDQLRERFIREGRVVARLTHPNVVTIFDVGEHDGWPFMAMEYIRGETLEKFIRRGAPVPVSTKVRLIVNLCDGLASAHKAGVIHRDIKPSNVMVTDEHVLKIIDFGVARLVDSDITLTGDLIGTPHYMSPEQLEGGAAGEPSDIFSVGLVMYELLALRRAFPGDNPRVVARSILSKEPQPLSELDPEIDADLVDIVTTALRKRPQDRYPNLAAMRRDLMRVATRLESVSRAKRVIGEDRLGALAAQRETATHWRRFTQHPRAFAAVCLGGIVAVALFSSTSLQRSAARLTKPTAPSAPPVAGTAPAQQTTADVSGLALVETRGSQPPTSSSPGSPQPAASGVRTAGPADQVPRLMRQARALRLRRDYDAAIARYQEILQLTPEDDEARAALRETLSAKQQADQALDRLARPASEPSTAALDAAGEARRLVGVALTAMGGSEDEIAQKALEDALRIDPGNTDAQRLLKMLTGR